MTTAPLVSIPVPPPPARYAVLGNPVQHSRSPEIHAAFAAQTGQAIVYTRLECPLDGFAESLRAFAADGAQGCNVTVPFKFEALGLAARATDRARLAGAANTLNLDGEGWLADNTDGIGLVRDIERNAGRALAGQRLLLVGAGGAAAGVLGPLLACAPREVVVCNRSPDKATALVDRHAHWAGHHGSALVARPIESPGEGFDLVINATASSLHGGGVPVPAAVLGDGALAVDLMYGPATDAFLDWARAHGATGRDGLGMLVEQAAEAFHGWRGVRPATDGVLAALRERVDQAAR